MKRTPPPRGSSRESPRRLERRSLHRTITAYRSDPRLMCCLAAVAELSVLLTMMQQLLADSEDGMLQLRSKGLLLRAADLTGAVLDGLDDEVVQTEQLEARM